MLQWLPVLFAAFVFVGLSMCYAWLLPMGFVQFAMVFSCLFFSVVLADVALLRQRLVRLERELAHEDEVLGPPRPRRQLARSVAIC